MVSDITLTQDVWNDMRTLLVAAAIQTTVGSDVKTASIRADYNDETSSKPQIVIETIPYDETLDKFGTVQGKKFINITIGCYATSNIAVEQLFDQVIYAVKSTEIAGVDLTGFTSDSAFNVSADSKVKMKGIMFSYDRE